MTCWPVAEHDAGMSVGREPWADIVPVEKLRLVQGSVERNAVSCRRLLTLQYPYSSAQPRKHGPTVQTGTENDTVGPADVPTSVLRSFSFSRQCGYKTFGRKVATQVTRSLTQVAARPSTIRAPSSVALPRGNGFHSAAAEGPA